MSYTPHLLSKSYPIYDRVGCIIVHMILTMNNAPNLSKYRRLNPN